MTSVADLLPVRSTTPFERALSRAVTDELPIPMRESISARTAPSSFLPFLAAHESVDLWFDDWSDERKRKMIDDALRLSSLKGTRAAAAAFLEYVDARIVDRVAYPRRFVVGRAAIGVDPIGHPPLTAHLLVQVPIKAPSRAFVIGKSGVATRGVRSVDRTPADRALQAVRVSKSVATFISVDFGHRRPRTVGDGVPLDGSFRFGDFIDRKRL